MTRLGTLFAKTVALLDRRERLQLAGLTFLVIAMGAAQVVGVGSVAPFVSVLVDPESARTNDWLRWAYDYFQFQDTDSFLLFLAIGVLAAVILSNALMALTQWALIRFSWRIQYRLSHRLLASYMALPFSAFLGRNSSDVGKNILVEVENFTGGVVMPLMRLLAYAVAAVFLIAALFWADPIITAIVIAVLGSGYGLIYVGIRRLLGRAGSQRIGSNTERFKIVSEAFGGLKELRVLGRESVLLRRYSKPAADYASAQSTVGIVMQIPAYAMQTLAIGVVLVLSVVLLGTSSGAIQGVAPLLAIYAFAAQRLTPFLQQAYQSAGQLRFNRVVADTLYDDIMGKPAAVQPAYVDERLSFRRELRLDSVSFSYPGSEKPVISGVSLRIPRRSFVAFVGATGAGKSTLVDLILGLLSPDKGTISVDGTNIDGSSVRAWQRNIGYVPQDIYLADDSIEANIAFGVEPSLRDHDAIERAARTANLLEFVTNELPRGFQTIVGERGVRLSGGQRQRIGIARALYHDPEVLIFDEATSELDQLTERLVHEAIETAAAAKTVILIAHRLTITKNCHSLFLLDRGRLVAQGTYADLVATSHLFKSMTGGDPA